MEENELKNMLFGIVRKRDGKIINVNYLFLMHKYGKADWINNELNLNDEIYIANSVRSAYYEATLNVVKSTAHGGNGTYQVNGITYDGNQSFTVEKGSRVNITILPDQNSKIESVVDDLGNPYQPVQGVVTVEVNENRTLTITFDINPT